MKKFLLATAILLPLGGCQSVWSFSLSDFILDDLLGCEGDRQGITAWYCTEEGYMSAEPYDRKQDPNDHDKPERNVEKDKPSPEVDKDKHGRHGRRGKRGRRGRHGHHGGHHGHKGHGED